MWAFSTPPICYDATHVSLGFKTPHAFPAYYYCQFMTCMLKTCQQKKIQPTNTVSYYELINNDGDALFSLSKNGHQAYWPKGADV